MATRIRNLIWRIVAQQRIAYATNNVERALILHKRRMRLHRMAQRIGH